MEIAFTTTPENRKCWGTDLTKGMQDLRPKSCGTLLSGEMYHVHGSEVSILLSSYCSQINSSKLIDGMQSQSKVILELIT